MHTKSKDRKRGPQQQDVAAGLALLHTSDGTPTRIVAVNLCCRCGEKACVGAHPTAWLPVCERCQRHGWRG
jgi:hypothetical protein